LKVTVLDMQPIDPPVGGGRLRLLGLYHNLGNGIDTVYVGTYDWPGPGYRRHNLSETLEEIDVPLSKAHFKAAGELSESLGGKTAIDVAFHQQAFLSPEYVKVAREKAADADIVIISHPWVWPLAEDILDQNRQILVYDSHNVEGLLRTDLLDDGGGSGTAVAREVVRIEYELCCKADLIITCSHADRLLYGKLYDIPLDRIRVMPNGVFTETVFPADDKTQEKARNRCAVSRPHVAFFLGSYYHPNIEAAAFIARELSPVMTDTEFVIGGGAGEGLIANGIDIKSKPNLRLEGALSEQDKRAWLSAADIAINPMFSGSGTNIKMFDFMAAGLPTVTTQTGARGIMGEDGKHYVLATKQEFVKHIKALLNNSVQRARIGKNARDLVLENYSWERISPMLGDLLLETWNQKQNLKTCDRLAEDSKADSTFCGEQQKMHRQDKRVAILSTWGVRCGIAEHTRYLVSALYEIGLRTVVFGNHSTDNDLNRREDYADPVPVIKVWNYSSVNPTQITLKCSEWYADHLNIQYHHGFFSEEQLIALVNYCYQVGIETSVTLHNTADLNTDTLIALNRFCSQLIGHSEIEQQRLRNQGIQMNVIPLGIPNIHRDMPARTEHSDKLEYKIATFGFLRPHKGVTELIQAISILKKEYPQLTLTCYTSLFPSKDSQECLDECRDLIARHSLEHSVIINEEFLELRTVIDCLSKNDIIVLPYHQSTEGASAAAHTALAAGRPVAVTPQQLFEDVSKATFHLRSPEPEELATDIRTLLESPTLRDWYANAAVDHARKNSWSSIAKRYAMEVFVKNNLIIAKSQDVTGANFCTAHSDKKSSCLTARNIDFPFAKSSDSASIDEDYDAQTYEVMKRVMGGMDSGIDIGAHTGMFVELMLKLAPDGFHYAFEPLPDLFAGLMQAYQNLHNIKLFEIALSDKEGETSFTHVVSNPGYSGIRKRVLDSPNEQIEQITVKQAPLDQIIPLSPRVAFMKVDVEGAEYFVFKGAQKTICEHRPIIVFEHGLGGADCYDVTPKDVYNLLYNKYQMNIYLIIEWLSGNKPLNREEFINQFYSGSNYYFLAAPR